METSYYILESVLAPGLYKVGISDDPQRRVKQHGSDRFNVVEVLPIGSRDNAESFEKGLLARYQGQRLRADTEDIKLSVKQLDEVRAALKAEHQRTRPKEKEGQQPVQVQPVKQEEGPGIDLDEFWSVVGAMLVLVTVFAVPAAIVGGMRQRQAEREAEAAFNSQALLFRTNDGETCYRARQDARWAGTRVSGQLCGPWAPGGWVNR